MKPKTENIVRVIFVIIAFCLVSLISGVVANNNIFDTKQKITIYQNECRNESYLIYSHIVDSKIEFINETFPLQKEYTDLREYENSLAPYLYYNPPYSIEGIRVNKFVEANYFNHQTAKLEPYTYLVNNEDIPLQILQDYELESPDNFFIRDTNYSSDYKEITIQFEVFMTEYDNVRGERNVCSPKEVEEIIVKDKLLQGICIEYSNYSANITINGKECKQISKNKTLCGDWDYKTISKSYLQEHHEWLDENCECISSKMCDSFPNCNASSEGFCHTEESRKNCLKGVADCSSYSCVNSEYEVKIG